MADRTPHAPARRKSVRYLLLRLLLVIALLLALQAGIYYRHYRATREKALQANLELARAVAVAFQDMIAALHRIEATVGYALTAGAPLTHEQQMRFLLNTATEFPAARDVAWTDAQGRVVAASDPSVVGRSAAGAAWFQEIAKGAAQVVGNTARTRDPKQDYFIAARGIRDEKGRLLGLVVAEISTKAIEQWIALKRIPGGRFEVIDRSGWQVFSSDPAAAPPEHRDRASARPLVKAALDGREVTGAQRSLEHQGIELVAEAPIPGVGWVAQASRDQAEVWGSMRGGLLADCCLVLLILALAALAALATARRITAPLGQLHHHALEVTNGNLEHRVEPSDTAELAEVAEAFNQMTQAAQDRDHEHQLRLEAERARAALAEGLTEEVSHHVRNTLTMVSGLLHMQLLKHRNTEIEPLLVTALGRIHAFADIHEEMYAARSTALDLLRALRRVAVTVRQLHGPEKPVEIVVSGDHLRYDSRIITNLAIAAGELMANAVLHGGPGADGKVQVKVQCAAADGQLRLSVWNSGPSLPAGFDLAKQAAMGLQIVSDLAVSRYGGTFTLAPSEGGTLAEIRVSEAALHEKT